MSIDLGKLGTIDYAAQQDAMQGAPPRGKGDKLGKEEFLLLLTTQLKHQDPTNPLQNHELAAQLAQFASVEQLTNIDGSLGNLGDLNTLLAQNINNGVATGLIGKTIEASGNEIGYEGEAATLGFHLAGNAEAVTVKVRNAAGAVVRTFELTDQDSGKHTIEWDGRNDRGTQLEEGSYTFEVEATQQGTDVASTPFVRGRAERITFEQDGIRVWLGGLALPMGIITSVEE